MTRDEFKTIAKVLKAVYTDPKFLPDKNAFDVWYRLIQDLDYQTVALVVEEYIATNKFPPTIADLREPLLDEDEDPLEAWALVLKALRNSISNSEEAYAKLPENIQIAVGSHMNLMAWAKIPSESLNTVAQSQFLSAYKSVCSRAHRTKKATPTVKAQIAPAKKQEALPMLDDEPKYELPFVEVTDSPFDMERKNISVEPFLAHKGVEHLRDLMEWV